MAKQGESGPIDLPTLAVASTIASSPGVAGAAPVSASAPDAMLGQTIADRYQVLSLLGRGGMGSVYVCEHVQLKKRMALKVLAEEFRRQPELVARFLKEARAAAQIGHANIVDVYDLGELPGGGAFIAMALLEGEDLQEELARVGAMPFSRARIIIGQVCRALAAAHQKGIVHRDMKPANVFLARDSDGNETVKVLDFGIAQVNEGEDGKAARLTQTGAIVGTPAFMSPEQGRGLRPDHRTDIYSVGCILYTLLTGDVPFTANNLMGVITQHLFDPPEPPSSLVPEGLITAEMDAVVLRTMAKNPADRYQTMKELWIALEACGDSPAAWPDAISGKFVRLASGISAPTPSMKLEASHSGRHAARVAASVANTQPEAVARPSRAPLVAGVAVLLGLLLVGAILLSRSSPVPAPPSVVPSPLVAPAAPMPAAGLAAEISIELRSTPPGAAVFRGEETLGTTPLRLLRPRSDQTFALRFALRGYEDQQLSFSLDRDRLVEVNLVREARPLPPTVAGKTHTNPTPGPAVKKPHITGRNGELKDPFSK